MLIRKCFTNRWTTEKKTIIFQQDILVRNFVSIVCPQRKGPLYKLFSFSRRTAVVPLRKIFMQFIGNLLAFFLSCVVALYPQATSRDHGWGSINRPSDWEARLSHFTIDPLVFSTTFIFKSQTQMLRKRLTTNFYHWCSTNPMLSSLVVNWSNNF